MVNLLEQHFTRLVDYGFTAAVEEDLDSIAGGGMQSVDWLTRFYFGSDAGKEGGIARAGGLKRLVAERLGDIDARGINSIPLNGDGVIVVRVGRYGPYLERGDGERASVPEDLPPDELTPEKVDELFSAPSGERVLGADPQTGLRRRGPGRPVRAVRVLRRADASSLLRVDVDRTRSRWRTRCGC